MISVETNVPHIALHLRSKEREYGVKDADGDGNPELTCYKSISSAGI